MDVETVVQDFEARFRMPGEHVLSFCPSLTEIGEPGVAVLTDRRICWGDASQWRWIDSLDPTLRYIPSDPGEPLRTRFETDRGQLTFVIVGEEETTSFGKFLQTIADVLEAQQRLQRADLDPYFISEPRDGAAEGVSALYRLVRLKGLLRQGVLGEWDFALERTMMIQRLAEEVQAR